MKKNRKKQKGFSLVELIVVIAVMAVLVVVLAPAYLRYVDKARLQKDISAVSEVIQATKIAAADPAVAKEIFEASATNMFGHKVEGITYVKININVHTGEITIKRAVGLGTLVDPTVESPLLQEEVYATVGNKIDFKSKILKEGFARTSLNKKYIILYVVRDENYNVSVSVNSEDFTGEAQEAVAKLGPTFESFKKQLEDLFKKMFESVVGGGTEGGGTEGGGTEGGGTEGGGTEGESSNTKPCTRSGCTGTMTKKDTLTGGKKWVCNKTRLHTDYE